MIRMNIVFKNRGSQGSFVTQILATGIESIVLYTGYDRKDEFKLKEQIKI